MISLVMHKIGTNQIIKQSFDYKTNITGRLEGNNTEKRS